MIKLLKRFVKWLNQPKQWPEGCDVCGSNCGQCGSSHSKRGDGSEVMGGILRSICNEDR